MLHQKRHDAQLNGGELDGFARAREQAGVHVEREVAVTQDLRACLPWHHALGATQVRIDARHGLERVEGLDHVVVCPEVEAQDLLGVLTLGGYDDDRHIAGLADALEHVVAVHHRHHDVEQAEIDLASLQHAEGLSPVGGLHDLHSGVLEVEREHAADVRLVICYQDAIGHGALLCGVVKHSTMTMRRGHPGYAQVACWFVGVVRLCGHVSPDTTTPQDSRDEQDHW